MPNRLTRRVRTAVLAIGAIGATALVVPTFAGAVPDSTSESSSKPQTIEEVQQQLGDLALTNTKLVEQYDQAQIVVSKRHDEAVAASREADKAADRLETVRGLLVQSTAAQYEGGSFSAAGALLSSESGESYLDTLDTLSLVSEHNTEIVHEVTVVKAASIAARKHADDIYADAKDKLAALSERKKQVQAQVDKYKTLLATLTQQQRAAYLAAHSPTASTKQITTATTKLSTAKLSKTTPAAARKAVEFALAQVGKPYVWGTAGPSTYDCSGLTMASYASVGVSLPHSSYQQYNYGHHVAFGDMRPGDLVFMYSPISHVEIYIGDGLAVSAPTEGEPVKVVSVGNDFAGATRLVG